MKIIRTQDESGIPINLEYVVAADLRLSVYSKLVYINKFRSYKGNRLEAGYCFFYTETSGDQLVI